MDPTMEDCVEWLREECSGDCVAVMDAREECVTVEMACLR